NWTKLGLIYRSDGFDAWKLHSALTPTPVVFSDKIRVYAGFRDAEGVSRIGFVDLDRSDPTKIIRISEKPALDIGPPGTFDDNGVILGDIIQDGDKLRMYYVGFQLVSKVKFLAFTGLAVSEDQGETFKRVSNVPVLDRRDNALFFNAVHTVMKDEGKYKCWLGAGSDWQEINGVQYPSYNVKYIESQDGVCFESASSDCITFTLPNEYRLGRPRVYKENGEYQIIFTWGDKQGRYEMGYATSSNGKNWNRNDAVLNFHPSASGWDDKWVSYGALFQTNNKVYMVYNGNEMGKDGFGLAVLNK
ncbi:MAG: hypothetical protein JWO32_3054, partial [Bacteroidetes bacterium]|nr:hypothetical protein [Bacteroidota bacterium]